MNTRFFAAGLLAVGLVLGAVPPVRAQPRTKSEGVALFNRGLQLQEAGEYDQAERIYRQVLEAHNRVKSLRDSSRMDMGAEHRHGVGTEVRTDVNR